MENEEIVDNEIEEASNLFRTISCRENLQTLNTKKHRQIKSRCISCGSNNNWRSYR